MEGLWFVQTGQGVSKLLRMDMLRKKVRGMGGSGTFQTDVVVSWWEVLGG